MTQSNPIQPPNDEQEADPLPIDWEDRYKRLAAELENTKKRLARKSTLAIEQKQDQLLLDMLPFVDNLERILSSQTSGTHSSQLVAGIRLTYQNVQNTLKRYGVETIEALNRPFDPALHEATALVEHPSRPGGIVIEVLQTGYLRDDRLLRPAQVIVSAD